MGESISRLRLAERRAAELQMQNTYLSAQLLEMSELVDRAAKGSHVDRLLTACLIAQFGDDARVEIPIAVVDTIKAWIGTPPGLRVVTAKDDARSVWVISVEENPATQGGVDPGAPNGDRTITSVRDCSSCGGDHETVTTRAATDAEERNGVLCVATCPTTGADVEVRPVDVTPSPARPSLIVMP